MDCRIVLAYHRPALVIENDVLTPLHVGRRVDDLDLGIRGDDTGDNISHKNIHYAELTALYWAWKNLPAADYLGLFHYRRLLDFSGTHPGPIVNLNIAGADDVIRSLSLNEAEICAACRKAPIITRQMEDLRDWSKHTVYSHYAAEHTGEHLRLAQKIVRRKWPAYAELFDRMLNGTQGYFSNMSVMRRDFFDEYCSWMFDVLAEVESFVNHYERRFQKYSPKARIYGFLGERLTSLFILKKKEEGVPVAEYTAVALVPNEQARWHDFNTYDRAYGAKPNGRHLRGFHTNSQSNGQKSDSGNIDGGRSAGGGNRGRRSEGEPIRVSVVMPAFNASGTIAETLKSVRQQTLEDVEVVVIDDGSTDETAAVAEQAMAGMPRFRLIRKRNEGPGVARKVGLDAANGQYIHFMDADDSMDPQFLELLFARGVEHHADIVVAPCRITNCTTKPPLVTETSLPYTVMAETCTDTVRTPDLFLLPGHLWDKLFRRDFLDSVEFPPFRLGDDLCIYWQAIARAQKVAVAKEALFNYNWREESIQSRADCIPDVFDSIRFILKALDANARNVQCRDYFRMFILPLLWHTLHKNRKNLLNNPQFRATYLESQKVALAATDPIAIGPLVRMAVYNDGFWFMLSLRGLGCEEMWQRITELWNGGRSCALAGGFEVAGETSIWLREQHTKRAVPNGGPQAADKADGEIQSEVLQALDVVRNQFALATSRFEALHSELTTVRRQLTTVRGQLNETRETLDKLWASPSWRITYPLRIANWLVREGWKRCRSSLRCFGG